MVKPSRTIGATVRWCPRDDHRLQERYEKDQVKTLESQPEWRIWADHPTLGWVWLVSYANGATITTHAALNDLDLVLK
jgi:hypothetical protein